MSPGAAARLAAEALVRALVDAGVAHAVIAPGSRSAPLVLALERLVREGATLGLHTIVDERAAAFFALGLARVSGRPALVCTTSGTAGAHALPAVIEADRDRLPLLVLTADRPPELHGVGAPQTVAQTQMFAPYVRLSADPGAPDAATSLAALATLAARAVAAALGAEGGPVHLNLPYREPLELADPPAPVGGFRPPPRVVQGPARLPASEVAALARRLCQCERGVLVSGPGDLPASGAPLAERAADLGRALAGLSGALGWPLVADSTSAARGHAPTEALVVTAADLLVRGAPFEATPPELVLRFGQVPTSRALTQWLARPAVGETWLVDPSGRFQDPDHRATGVLAADPARLADDLTAAIRELGHRPRPQWAAAWREAQAVADQRLAEAADADAGLWAGSVARAVVEALPAGGLLHVASSLPIRAVDAFGGLGRPGLTVTANRGANGIDGTVATALGEAAAWGGGPVAVLLGDLAFLHDLSALVVCPPPRSPVAIVVFDNAGGGIFDHLPIAAHPTAFEPHFITAPRVSLASTLAGLPARLEPAGSLLALRRALSLALATPGPTLIHVPVDRARDLARHQELRAAVCGGLPTLTASQGGPP